jgi:hypothetical protein
VSAYVVVQLVPVRRTKAAHGEHAALTDHKVKRLLTEHGAEVIHSPEPRSAGSATPMCATIVVADMACASKLAAALRGMDGIETAYAKPVEELP